MTAAHNAYQSTKHGQVHYAQSGTGFPLLLLSETPRSYRFFRVLQPLLAAHAHVFAVDLPGLGNSHGLPNPTTIPAIAACLVDFIDALGLDQVDVFGMNTGDKVGAALAAGWPKRVRRLVLAGYTHSLIPERETRDAALQPFFEHYYPPKYEPSADGSHLIREWAATHATTETAWWPAKLLTEKVVTPDQVRAVENQVIDYLLGWRSAVPIYKAVFAFDYTEAAGRIEAPTLVLELSTPQEKHFGPQAERLAKRMKRATPATVEVTFGSAIETEAKEIAEAILSFLQSTESISVSKNPQTPAFVASGQPAIPPTISSGYRMERIVEGSGFHTLNGVAFGPDGRLFAASMSGESIFALDLASGRVETVVESPLGASDDLIFTKGGDIIWTAVLEGAVRKRDRHGRITDLARDLPGVNSLALTRDGTRLFMGQVFLGEGLWEIDLEGVKKPRLVLAKTGGLNAFQFGADGMIYGPSWFNGTVLRIDPDSGKAEVIATGFTKPGAVRFDSKEQLYVLDNAPGELFQVNPEDGAKRLIARLATATDNFAVGPNDLLYVSNMVDNSVHEVDPRTGDVRIIVKGQLGFPRAIAAGPAPQGDRLYVADCSSYRIVDPRTGGIEDVARAVVSDLQFPSAVSANKDHVVLVSEILGTIQIVQRASGKFLHDIKGFEKPADAIELDDGSLIVSEPAAGRLLRVTERVLPIFGYQHDVIVEGLNQPCGLADAHDGTIYVAETGSGRLLRVSVPEGRVSEVSSGLGAIRAVAVAPDGTVLTLDGSNGCLVAVDPGNGRNEVIARGLAVGYLQTPYARSGGLAVGSDGTIYVAADRENAIDRIIRT